METKGDLWKNISKDAIAFSFDDGYPADLEFANFLSEQGYQNILFYIPLKNSEGRAVMSPAEILEISKKYEIGGHTYHHIDLTTLSLAAAKEEIITGKDALEQIIGRKLKSFCPPRGHYNQKILQLVKEAGFEDARSARLYNVHASDRSQFLWHPNIHYYHHSWLIDLLHSIKQVDLHSFAQRIQYLNKSHLEQILPILQQQQKIHIRGHTREINFSEFKQFIYHLNTLLGA